jgi:hypothetical protein
MKELKNQTVYKCEYCNKRLMTKWGAKVHENMYCKDDQSPHMKAVHKQQSECEHTDYTTIWESIPGQAEKEPRCDICNDCGLEF